MFIDEADIYVKGGDGGAGRVSFRREKFVPMGGPDGGQGGQGGSVFLRADNSVDTLVEFAGHHHWRAEDGLPGGGKDCSGKSGEDMYVRVPPGTQIFDSELGLMLADLDQPGATVCVARGGRGGRGNGSFATSIIQAPKFAEPGTPGQERDLHLELKLIADVGLIGMPNAGKSTLLSVLSDAHPKIANYPFTTLNPQLGICDLPGERRFVMADLPGLIEGAHMGVGLGDAFLKHVERTRVLCHLVEHSPMNESDPLANYRTIHRELAMHSKALAEKRELIVITKLDIPGGEPVAKRLAKATGHEVIQISAVTGQGLRALAERLWQMTQADKQGLSVEPAELGQPEQGESEPVEVNRSPVRAAKKPTARKRRKAAPPTAPFKRKRSSVDRALNKLRLRKSKRKTAATRLAKRAKRKRT